MTAGRLARLALLVIFIATTGWFTIWPLDPGPIQAQPLEGPDAGRAVREDDLLDQVLAAGTLVVGTDANYAPWSFLNTEGELDGFDVDVAKEVATRLGVAIEFETPSWSDVTAGGWDALWDVSIGSMTPTDVRALVLWFTDPYYYVPGIFAVHKDNTTFTVPADLSGETVGVGTATTYEDYLEGQLELDYGGVLSFPPPLDVVVQAYSTDAEAVQDLALGDGVRLDAVISSHMLLQGAIDEGLPIKLLGTSAFSQPIVMALDQDRGPSDGMIAALNTIIADMRDDGTLTDISLKWLGFDCTEPGPRWLPSERAFLPLVLR